MEFVMGDNGELREATYIDYTFQDVGHTFERIMAFLVVGNFEKGGIIEVQRFAKEYELDINESSIEFVVEELHRDIGSFKDILVKLSLSEYELYNLFELLYKIMTIDESEKGKNK